MEQKPAFDLRTIVAVVLCIGILWGWQKYLQQKYPEAPVAPAPAPAPAETASVDKGVSGAVAGTATASVKKEKARGPEQFWNYEDTNWRLTVSSFGGRISALQLKKYKDKDGNAVTLISPESRGVFRTRLEGSTHLPDFSNSIYSLKAVSKEKVELTAEEDGLVLKKIFEIKPDQYLVSARVLISGKTAGVQKIDVDVFERAPVVQESKTFSFLSRGAGQEVQEYYFSHGTKTNRENVTAAQGVDKSFEQTHMAALGSRYFTVLGMNRSGVLPEGRASREGNFSVLTFGYPILEHGTSSVAVDMDFYMGPKSVGRLNQLGGPATSVVDMGMFSWIAVPLLQVMKWLFGLFGNYGLAIIALTILVRLVTFPFTYYSYKSMKAMQKIQPEIARLKEVYKGNTQALNVEMMKLMRENKVNPMGGCLPLLLQLPVFWALYQVLQNSIELYRAPFFGWITDLSMKDPYYVLPVLMGLSMFVQQKITPSTMDPAQARVMMIMPIMFSFLMFGLPSGLTLYIFVSTLFGIIQQMIMMRDKNESGHVVVRRA